MDEFTKCPCGSYLLPEEVEKQKQVAVPLCSICLDDKETTVVVEEVVADEYVCSSCGSEYDESQVAEGSKCPGCGEVDTLVVINADLGFLDAVTREELVDRLSK